MSQKDLLEIGLETFDQYFQEDLNLELKDLDDRRKPSLQIFKRRNKLYGRISLLVPFGALGQAKKDLYALEDHLRRLIKEKKNIEEKIERFERLEKGAFVECPRCGRRIEVKI